MNPFYFGRSDRRLFGIYDAPAAAGTVKRAAILCQPWGPEYLYAHRTMRQLALKLAAEGIHALRFDYFGAGDSGGEAIDLDLQGCEADLETAIDEVRDMAGSVRITLIGLRLGASIAARVAIKPSVAVDSLVIWDPIMSGAQYLQQLGVAPDATPPVEALGVRLSTTMLRDLKALTLGPALPPDLPRTLMLLTDPAQPHRAVAPTNRDSATALHTIEFREDVCPWLESTANMGLAPYSAIQRIVTWLG